MSRIGREALGMSRTGRESISDGREWSGGPTKFLGVVGTPSQLSGSGREALPYFRE